MNLFDLFIRIGVKDEASDHISNLSTKLGNGLKTAAKIGTAAVGAAATGIVAMTKSAVDNYAAFEQLVGGTELLFGDAFQAVMTNAREAYKNVQMSQNEYLQQVNGFATGLKTALGGNEQAAAELANRIIQAEADIVAATGNTQENVANAFAGIMKSNFTMLDNLQIGITPTKEGFQEVIDKVNEWNAEMGNATNYQMGNLADMQSALVDYIDMVGMAGYAQNEAAGTISGSIASTKALWSDFMTSLADGNADYQWYVDELINSVGVVLSNVAPVAQQVFWSIADAVQNVLPALVAEVPAVLEGTVFKAMAYLVDTGTKMLPQVVALGLNTVVSLAEGIAQNLPELVPSIVDVVLQIVETLTNPDSVQALVMASLAIIIALAEGLIDAMPQLLEKVPVIVGNLVNVFLRNAPQLLAAAGAMVVTLINGIADNIPSFLNMAAEMVVLFVRSVKQTVTNFIPDMVEVGKNIVNGVWKGIQNMAATFTKNVKNFFGNIVSGVKKTLGIASPSKVFAGIGGYMVEGLAKGWDDQYETVRRGIMDDMHFDVGNVEYSASGMGRAYHVPSIATEQEQGEMTIIVQSVLDGKIIGETAYQYAKGKQRAYGV